MCSLLATYQYTEAAWMPKRSASRRIDSASRPSASIRSIAVSTSSSVVIGVRFADAFSCVERAMQSTPVCPNSRDVLVERTLTPMRAAAPCTPILPTSANRYSQNLTTTEIHYGKKVVRNAHRAASQEPHLGPAQHQEFRATPKSTPSIRCTLGATRQSRRI